MNLRKILLTTDFSECSAHAFPPAAAIARRNGAAIDLVNVGGAVSPLAFGHTGGGFAVDEFYAGLEGRLAEVARRDVFRGVEVHPHLLEGFGPESVARFQETHGHELLVTATHGHSGIKRLLLGSFAEGLVRRARCPVLTYRGTSEESEFRPRRVLWPHDFSDLSRTALRYVRELATLHGAEVHVLHVVNAELYPIHPVGDFPVSGTWWEGGHPDLWAKGRDKAQEELAKLLAEELHGAKASAVAAVGNPLREILAHASDWKADLIVLSTHGRTGLSHAFLGSVAERVVRGAPCTVLTVRPAA
jgi:nucleotide-binding universal stress UspA family protein